ncbi:STM4504/CBY_0614 family protein [Lysinibacillus xylanilyticus]|uniref:STM4504/CBY_0614 family protein n=1 Tax=Lysinibacillus xylanilyticus TaxID=582475 RepID=UPI003D07B0A1
MFELYSRRNGIVQQSDIYEYDVIPRNFRNQFANILVEVSNKFDYHDTHNSNFWEYVKKDLVIELGIYNLTTTSEGISENGTANVVLNYLIQCADSVAIDVMDFLIYKHYEFTKHKPYIYHQCQSAFSRINQKLKQNSLGYEILGNQLIRIDNQYIHSEIVKKAIVLLQEQEFHSVSDEFLKAHEHYKQGDYKDAVVNAGKAFESTMKTICSKCGYSYDSKKDTANILVKHMFEIGIIPTYMQSHIQGLKQALENSVNVLRNKNGSHGQGEDVLEVDDSIVRYTLNLCATNIVFLVERYKETK